MASDISLSPIGSGIQGTISSFINMAAWQPLFAVKSYQMMGKGLPPLSHLYRGYRINVLADMSNQGVAFLVFRAYSFHVYNDFPMSAHETLGAGVVAGIAAAPLQGACERVMILQQLQKTPLSIMTTLNKIHLAEGACGVFRGLVPTMMRESVNTTCFFGLSQFFYGKMITLTDSVYVANSVSYLAAGIFGGILTTPADVIKTRIQSRVGKAPSISEIIKEVGYRNLFKGGLARAGTIGATMMTLGLLSKEIPLLLPRCLHSDYEWSILPSPPLSGRRPSKP